MNILTGFEELDKMLGGLHPSDCIGDATSDDWLALLEMARCEYQKKFAEEKAEQERLAAEEERLRLEKIEQKRSARIEKITSMDLPLSWGNQYSADERAKGIHAESISDGLILSLNNLGAADIEYIAQVSGYSCKEVIQTLKGSIFQNPERWNECFYKGWETSDEYLSGNLMRKYKSACEANEKYNGYFSDNIKAIEAVLPTPIPADEIYVTLGSPWIPPDIIDDFIEFLLGKVYSYDQHGDRVTYRELYPVVYEPITGTWDVPCKNRYNIYRNHKSKSTYGTKRINAMHIIEKTLNMRTLQVFDKVPSQTSESGEKRQLNKDETISVQEKQNQIISEFQKWIWQDEERRERLVAIYEEKFGCVRGRHFDGSFLTIPGISEDVTLYPYQKNAIARILFTPATLLAHDVGAGKTYIMIASGMEMRRMGISRKNVYVVPNNIVGQWQDMFLQLYPQANVLTVEPKSFTPKKRFDMLKTIRDKDFDAIIIAYSCFEMIPLSHEYYEQRIERQLAIVGKVLKTQKRYNSRLEKKQEKLKEKLSDIRKALSKSIPSICFDDLGINTLFVDEAHNFKNISIDSKVDNVLGINKKGSAKCNEMLHKVHCVKRSNNGRGIVFATGTPITNSVTDIFVMQTYLQYGEMKFLDINHFDNWALNFGEKVTEFEVDVDTSAYRLATRFSKFHNLPELTNLLNQIADFHKSDKTNEFPDFYGYDDKVISKSAEMESFLRAISARADDIRSGAVRRAEDNMLKLTTDGRKAALDMRLAVPDAVFTYDSKVYRCAENVLNIYRETAVDRLTQLVFCDTSTPKAGFNIYNELKDLLVYHGIPENEIAFVHDFDTEKRRSMLFENMQSGRVRVLLGSTFKLGMGVNVQRKLYAIHHLDVPWRPADMTQREGRILRQGNENKAVRIFRYITDGSFDAYSWQLLESKQRFICQLLSGSVTERSASDIDDVVLSYAEIKALAIGNPLIKKRVETDNELKRMCSLQRKLVDMHSAMKQELMEIPGEIAQAKLLIEKAEADVLHYYSNRVQIKEMKNHRQIGAEIIEALAGHIMQPSEKTLMKYQGFGVVLPQNMAAEKPFVWLVGSGRYYTETGDSDIGCINRIDNKLSGLPDFIKKQEQELHDLSRSRANIDAELRKGQSYAPDIERLREKLKKIDKELGVKNGN